MATSMNEPLRPGNFVVCKDQRYPGYLSKLHDDSSSFARITTNASPPLRRPVRVGQLKSDVQRKRAGGGGERGADGEQIRE